MNTLHTFGCSLTASTTWPTDLANKIRWAFEHPEEMICMGKNARSAYEARYTPENNYQQLIAIYQAVIDKKRRFFFPE
jgi:glycosyltransferase involved in cell wall biosynthesis